MTFVHIGIMKLFEEIKFLYNFAFSGNNFSQRTKNFGEKTIFGEMIFLEKKFVSFLEKK